MSDELERETPTGEAGSATAAGEVTAKPVTRRLALKVIGSVPVAGAMLGNPAFAQQGTPSGAQQPKQTHEAPHPPAQGQGTPPSSAPKRAFFTAAEWRKMHQDGTTTRWLQQVTDFFVSAGGIQNAVPAAQYFDPKIYLETVKA